MVYNPGGGGGGDSHFKQRRVLVVSFRGVNFGFSSRLGCSGQSANIFLPPRSRLGFHEETELRGAGFFSIIMSLCHYNSLHVVLVCFKLSLLGVKICLSYAQTGLL